MASVRCSSLHKETIHSACFSAAQCATLPAWHITPSHWEIVVVGGWSSGWGMMHPTHYAAGLLAQRKLMSPPCNDGTQCSVTYDMCSNSKHICWGCCSFWLFYVGHSWCTGAQRGRKDVFHATHKGRKSMPLRCDFLSHHAELCGTRLWHWTMRKVELRTCPSFSILRSVTRLFSFTESHSAHQECYKSLLMRREMVWQAEVKLHCKCKL